MKEMDEHLLFDLGHPLRNAADGPLGQVELLDVLAWLDAQKPFKGEPMPKRGKLPPFDFMGHALLSRQDIAGIPPHPGAVWDEG